ncbi:tail fiber assembly protein [Cronobacter sakazakii]|nr:tail fiber assembly protein [Cronobacter sakazakii]
MPVDHIGKAEATRQRLLSLASQSIAPLQDAVDLGVSTEEEELLLKAWKIFRIEVNRINTSMAPNIEWPSKPS